MYINYDEIHQKGTWGKMGKQRKGITGVKLAVGLIVIAILAALTIPLYASHNEKARVEACRIRQQTILRQLQTERTRNPAITMAELLESAGAEKRQCPAGGSYHAVGADGLGCSLEDHGELDLSDY